MPTTTTTSTTTTTLPPTTTTSTIPPTPAELRADFLASLDDDGWTEYEDSVIGWSIRYPAGWELVVDEPGSMVAVSPPDGGLLIVTMQQDALGDLGSYEYLKGNLDYSINDGVLNTNEKSDEFWLDHDFDGNRGPLDIAGLETSPATNPITGETVPEGVIPPHGGTATTTRTSDPTTDTSSRPWESVRRYSAQPMTLWSASPHRRTRAARGVSPTGCRLSWER
jgi:hypothetical protein